MQYSVHNKKIIHGYIVTVSCHAILELLIKSYISNHINAVTLPGVFPSSYIVASK